MPSTFVLGIIFNTSIMISTLSRKIFITGLCLLSLGILSACEEPGEESPILVFLTPNETQIDANSGERVFITIKSSTNQGNSLGLKIESIDDYYGIRNVEDTLFNNSNINYRFEYLVPAYPDSTQSLLVFTLNNEANESVEIAKRILVNRGDAFLQEASGVNIYSSSSSKPNAFSLAALSPGFSADTASFESDFLDATVMDSDTLSRIWTSNTGVNFVKFNGFNYANATSLSIRNAYSNGVQLSKVSDIRDSDIYLLGRGNEALGVVQIIAVTDPEGAQEDKYTFSIKVVQE